MSKWWTVLLALIAAFWVLPLDAAEDGWSLEKFVAEGTDGLVEDEEPDGVGEYANDPDPEPEGALKPGLAAHYYADPPYWGGNWPDAIGVPWVNAANWTRTRHVATRVESRINRVFKDTAWFTIRWKGILDTTEDGRQATYVFTIWADDGCRLTIDGETVIDDWKPTSETSSASVRTRPVTLEPGKHTIVVDYFQGQNIRAKEGDKDDAVDPDPIKLYWECPELKIPRQIVPASRFLHSEEDLVADPGRADEADEEE
jgi:hypothetical protein